MKTSIENSFLTSTSSILTTHMKSRILKLKTGDKIIFDNIYVRSKQGHSKWNCSKIIIIK